MSTLGDRVPMLPKDTINIGLSSATEKIMLRKFRNRNARTHGSCKPWLLPRSLAPMRRKRDHLLGVRPTRPAMPSVTVNGTELYHEVRGTGPPVLLMMGATGDGGHFDKLADVLADEFTVISYDRRGNGRSPVPADWQTTSAEEQADDAAALLDALGVGPAAVFGTSSGGNFALWLLVLHPEAVRGAILHEPGLYALVDDFDGVRAPVRALVQEATEAGGPAAAVEPFWCYVSGDDDAWNRLAPELRERLRATASTLFGVELGTYELSLPDEERLASIAVPVRLLVSEDGLPFFAEIAGRLGERLGVDVATTPGRHDAYHEYPYEFAEAMRPFLREASGVT